MARRIKRTLFVIVVSLLFSFCNVFRGMCADVVKTIGAAGDYTSFALWKADLDDDGVYDASDVAIAELIDSTISGNVIISEGGTLGLAGITIRAAAVTNMMALPALVLKLPLGKRKRV